MTVAEWVVLAMVKAWALTSPIAGATPLPVANAIATASIEKPLFAGADGWRRTASVMTAIARYESGFKADAKGDCKDKPPGWPGCGGAGTTPTSFCFMQIHLPDGAKTAEGWTADDVLTDPMKCARAGREIIRRSITSSPAGEPLKAYAGRSAPAKVRWDLAVKLLAEVAWTTEAAP